MRILQHTATHCNTLQHTASHCNAMSRQYIHTTSQKSRDVLAYAVPKYEYSNALQHTATHCQTLLHTATKYITHTATHCNTLQHTANTSQPSREVRDLSFSGPEVLFHQFFARVSPNKMAFECFEVSQNLF